MRPTGSLLSLWSALSARHRRWVVAAQGISLIMACSTIVSIAAITPFFSVMGDVGLIQRNPWLSALYEWGRFRTSHTFILALGIGFVAIALVGNLINLLGSYSLQRVAFGIGNDMKLLLFREYLRRDLRFHAQSSGSTLLNNIVFEVVRGPIGMLQSIFQILTGVLTSTAIVVSILIVNRFAAIAVVAILGGGYCGVYVAIRKKITHTAREEGALVGEQMRLIGDALSVIRHLLLSGRQEYFQRRFENTCRQLARLAAFNDMATNSPRHIIECVAVGTLVTACLISIDSERSTGQWLAQLTFLGFAVYRLLPSLQQSFAGLVKLRGASTGFAAISHDLLIAKHAAALRKPAAAASHVGPPDIELRQVSFSYNQDGAPALDDVSLYIPAGAVVGIVGGNGSGKSSLVDLIAGFLKPDRGVVLINGAELGQLDIESWRASVSYVPQQTVLLDGSVAENIALGVAADDVEPKRMRRASRLALLDELVAQLPGGFQQAIGEHGTRLSGGQAQRVAVARALYRDCSLLILDEATSSLDAESEKRIAESVESIRDEATVLIIAHRRSALKYCDFILELDRGRVMKYTKAAPPGVTVAQV